MKWFSFYEKARKPLNECGECLWTQGSPEPSPHGEGPLIQSESCEHSQYTFSPLLFLGGRRGSKVGTGHQRAEAGEKFGVGERYNK